MFNYKALFDLTGKSALVIRAGSSIGQMTAQGLAAFGARVFCDDVNATANAETVTAIAEAGGQASALALELTDPAGLNAALAAELGPRGVRINAIAPGVVETPLTAPIKNRPDLTSLPTTFYFSRKK